MVLVAEPCPSVQQQLPLRGGALLSQDVAKATDDPPLITTFPFNGKVVGADVRDRVASRPVGDVVGGPDGAGTAGDRLLSAGPSAGLLQVAALHLDVDERSRAPDEEIAPDPRGEPHFLLGLIFCNSGRPLGPGVPARTGQCGAAGVGTGEVGTGEVGTGEAVSVEPSRADRTTAETDVAGVLVGPTLLRSCCSAVGTPAGGCVSRAARGSRTY